jgi:hypothetical protein
MLLRCESVEPPMSQLGQRETRALPCSGRLSWSLATFEADILGALAQVHQGAGRTSADYEAPTAYRPVGALIHPRPAHRQHVFFLNPPC